jgi:transcriptional antiterminator RfaH
MEVDITAWYCVRTKPKHEHIAAGNVRKHLSLQVFNPQLRSERHTRRGIARITEALFPGYIFVRCVLSGSLDAIRYAYGVNTVVQFGDFVPVIPDGVIEELRSCFPAEEPVTPEDPLKPGLPVVVNHGAFAGMQALVLRLMPARQRVQVLLDILGRPTEVEVDRLFVRSETATLADRLPFLAARRPEMATA